MVQRLIYYLSTTTARTQRPLPYKDKGDNCTAACHEKTKTTQYPG